MTAQRNAESFSNLSSASGSSTLPSAAGVGCRAARTLTASRSDEDARGEEEGAGTGEQHDAECPARGVQACTLATAAFSRRGGAMPYRDHSMYASIVTIDPSARYFSSVTLMLRRCVWPPEICAS